MTQQKKDCLLNVDIETNGLLKKHHILEIACVLTDTDFNEIAHFQRIVLPTYSVDLLDKARVVDIAYHDADEFVQNMHTENGLWDALRGPESVLLETAEVELVSWLGTCLQVHELAPPYVGGASVHFDRKHLEKRIPSLIELCSHRCFDVSTLKREFEWWLGMPVPKLPRDEGGSHRAMSDIRYSIREGQWMRQKVRALAGLA